MIRKMVLFRNLVDNLVKNAGLYSVGVILVLLYGFSPDPIGVLLGLAALLITYSSVYVFNDIFDIDEDSAAGEKATRKPLTQGTVNRTEAVIICGMLLIIGFTVSALLGLLFLGTVCGLIIVNVLYSAPMIRPDEDEARSLKHTVAGPLLILTMQFLKILLPWTLGAELSTFPILFALGFALLYLIIFRGYKENETIGRSLVEKPILSAVTIVVFLASLFIHPEPLFQALILMYLLFGILLFWRSHLIDRKVLRLAPFYVILGVIILYVVMTYI